MDYKINSEQQEMMDTIISGILPHKNLDTEVASKVIAELKKFLLFKDLYGIYYVFWRIINNIELIDLYRSGYSKSINKEILDRSLQASLGDLITRESFDSERYFGDFGQTFNLSIATERNNAMNFVYTNIMGKYDELMEMAVSSSESLATVSLLRDNMKMSMSALAVALQSQILQDGIYYNKKSYHGYGDWLAFTTLIHNEISSRFSRGSLSKRHAFTQIGNYEESMIYDNENSKDIHSLWYMGWSPVDDRFPINTHDIVTIVADEGTGKTRIVVDQAYRALVAGNNIVIVCGETDEFKIKRFIESRHIWETYHRQLSLQELNDPSIIAVSDLEEKIELENMIIAATTDLYDNPRYGKLILVQNMTYESIEEQLREEYKNTPFDIVFIDHVAALDSSGRYVNGDRLGTMQEKITHLYRVEDVLAKELNLAFVNTSHTNNDTAAAIKRNKETGVRIGGQSAATTKYASIVILIRQPEDLKKSDQIVLEFKKIRDHEPITMPLVLNRNSSNEHIYIEEYQYLVKGEFIENEDLESLYS